MSDLSLTDVAGAAKILGLSHSRVKQLDAVLRPLRFGAKQLRIYDVAKLERYAAVRDSQVAGKVR